MVTAAARMFPFGEIAKALILDSELGYWILNTDFSHPEAVSYAVIREFVLSPTMIVWPSGWNAIWGTQNPVLNVARRLPVPTSKSITPYSSSSNQSGSLVSNASSSPSGESFGGSEDGKDVISLLVFRSHRINIIRVRSNQPTI